MNSEAAAWIIGVALLIIVIYFIGSFGFIVGAGMFVWLGILGLLSTVLGSTLALLLPVCIGLGLYHATISNMGWAIIAFPAYAILLSAFIYTVNECGDSCGPTPAHNDDDGKNYWKRYAKVLEEGHRNIYNKGRRRRRNRRKRNYYDNY